MKEDETASCEVEEDEGEETHRLAAEIALDLQQGPGHGLQAQEPT